MSVAATALICLALNVYHEARGESIEGQRAVAAVTMNRAEGEASQVCNEVFRYHQFSWTDSLKTGRKHSIARRQAVAFKQLPKKTDRSWVVAQDVARMALAGKIKFAKDITFYHTLDVAPAWSKSAQFKVATVIGEHKFYRKVV